MDQYIATRIFFEIMVTEKRRIVSTVLLQWWEQAGIWFRYGGEVYAEEGNLELG